jgi:hypothetical protein
MKKVARTIDFKTASHDDLDDYGMQMLIYDAPELSVVLRGHLLIEQVIEALIAQKMKYPDRFFNNQRISFEMKVDLASALGVLPETHLGAAKAMNNIRNSYAHREDHSLSIDELNSLKIRWDKKQKQAFDMACTKGVDEAARLAIIFLNWSFLKLLPQANA